MSRDWVLTAAKMRWRSAEYGIWTARIRHSSTVIHRISEHEGCGSWGTGLRGRLEVDRQRTSDGNSNQSDSRRCVNKDIRNLVSVPLLTHTETDRQTDRQTHIDRCTDITTSISETACQTISVIRRPVSAVKIVLVFKVSLPTHPAHGRFYPLYN